MYDRLRQDNARILGTGFTLAVTFTDPTGVECPAMAFFSDTSLDIDANGMPVVGRRVMLSVNLLDADGNVQFTTAHNPSVGEHWLVDFTYNGQAFHGEVIRPMFDRTLGMITMNVQKRRTA